MNENNAVLIQRVRNKKNVPVGVLVAGSSSVDNRFVTIGWSLCNRKDAFDFETGKLIAFGRASYLCGDVQNIPHTLMPKYTEFVDRCKRYFKGQTIVLSKNH